MNHGDLVTICADHGEPWVPSVRACGPVTIGAIGRHEDLADWEEYADEVGRSEILSALDDSTAGWPRWLATEQ